MEIPYLVVTVLLWLIFVLQLSHSGKLRIVVFKIVKIEITLHSGHEGTLL